MKSAGIRQAKAQLSALARAAAAGEATVLTDYGKPIAMISSLAEDPALAEDPVRAEVPVAPIEESQPPTDAAAFRRALLSAPYELALDF
jgi:antitoxin (DNA-binding transcriptional repressor) of toxin-antitoxin stability system